jgi:hypothetical protein
MPTEFFQATRFNPFSPSSFFWSEKGKERKGKERKGKEGKERIANQICRSPSRQIHPFDLLCLHNWENVALLAHILAKELFN